ncbi:MAG: zinc ribbon domain-containing protein [Myxococcales bacterium]
MTYEYACTACGHAWEAEQSISAPPLTECPNCHQAHAKRQISGGAGFILKGGGWYADLYSSTGGGAKAEPASSSSSESKPKTDSASTSTTSSDTSSAAAAPAKPSTTGAASS